MQSEILIKYFLKERLHAVVKDGEEPMSTVTLTNMRTLAMLPVKRVVQRTETTFRASFLVDTGLPGTYFTQTAIDALGLNVADNQSVFW